MENLITVITEVLNIHEDHVQQLYKEHGDCSFDDVTITQIAEIVEAMKEKTYTEKEVIEIAKEAVGLWRFDADKKLYQSRNYFGIWIKAKLKGQ